MLCGEAGFHGPGLAAPFPEVIGQGPAGQGMARTRLTRPWIGCELGACPAARRRRPGDHWQSPIHVESLGYQLQMH